MAVHMKAAGQGDLTRTEVEVLGLLADGLSPQEIAERRHVAKRTIDFHLWNAYHALGVRRAIPAINEARRRGLIE